MFSFEHFIKFKGFAKHTETEQGRAVAYQISGNLVNHPMTSGQERKVTIQEDQDFRVMRLIESNPEITQRELAENLGVSLGKLNYCVKALIEKGMVKVQNFSVNENKLGYAYLLTPKGIAQKAVLTKSFLQRKIKEFDALKAEIESLGCDQV